jgi:hypothetical protein
MKKKAIDVSNIVESIRMVTAPQPPELTDYALRTGRHALRQAGGYAKLARKKVAPWLVSALSKIPKAPM